MSHLLKQLAKKIPDNIRSERLTGKNNLIVKAGNGNNEAKVQLAKLNYLFLEPNKSESYCPICLTNILNNFKNLQASLNELEAEAKLYDSL